MTEHLPEFDKPPVVEVAMAVQFEPLSKLRTPQLGALWQDQFRGRFPLVEEHAPLEPMMERFGAGGAPRVGVQVEMLNKPPTPRCWFVREDQKEIVQIQKDRFAHNWRKTEIDDVYPRYRDHLRPTFQRELMAFTDFIEREEIGKFAPNQCEITYVNLIDPCSVWARHGQAGAVLSVLSGALSEAFLPEPEELRAGGSFVIRQGEDSPTGRLRFSFEPGIRKSDGSPILRLNRVARGAPLDDGLEGVLSFMDRGREWIVREFTALTSKPMHAEWGRTK